MIVLDLCSLRSTGSRSAMRWGPSSSSLAGRFRTFGRVGRHRLRGTGPTTPRWRACWSPNCDVTSTSTGIDWPRSSRAGSPPERDYGHATATTLRRIRNGAPGRETSAATFEGRGSCVNGAAMRVAPLGAYYWDDPQRAVTEAVRSAPGDSHAPRRRGRGGRRGRRGRAGRLCPPHPLSAHRHRIPHRRPGTSRTGRDDAWHLPGA